MQLGPHGLHASNLQATNSILSLTFLLTWAPQHRQAKNRRDDQCHGAAQILHAIKVVAMWILLRKIYNFLKNPQLSWGLFTEASRDLGPLGSGSKACKGSLRGSVGLRQRVEELFGGLGGVGCCYHDDSDSSTGCARCIFIWPVASFQKNTEERNVTQSTQRRLGRREQTSPRAQSRTRVTRASARQPLVRRHT